MLQILSFDGTNFFGDRWHHDYRYLEHLKNPLDTVGELKSVEICISHMPPWKAKKPEKLTQEKVLLEL
jgi:hypothetical protein